jgi:hypothetical protein
MSSYVSLLPTAILVSLETLGSATILLSSKESHMCAAAVNYSRTRNALFLMALLGAYGCTSKESADLGWARTALERNPQLEVLASDPKTNVVTIRIKATGTVRTVKPEELAAAPQDLFGPPMQTANTQVASHSAPPPETSTMDASPDESAPPPQVTPPSSATAASTPSPEEQPGTATYKIAREDGRVRVSGPGVSIVSMPAAKDDAARPTAPPSDPIVCDGKRFMHLDSRNINVSGDAVIARNGCELHITNSRITAIAGAGISVENATVHLANTQVTGTDASIEAGNGAKLFIRSSTFTGVLKRSEGAEIKEGGGNEWK